MIEDDPLTTVGMVISAIALIVISWVCLVIPYYRDKVEEYERRMNKETK